MRAHVIPTALARFLEAGMQVLSTPNLHTGLDPITVTDAARCLADLGHPNPRLHHDHRVVSPNLRAALLELWTL